MSALSASGQVLQRADARMELGLWKFIGGRGGGGPCERRRRRRQGRTRRTQTPCGPDRASAKLGVSSRPEKAHSGLSQCWGALWGEQGVSSDAGVGPEGAPPARGFQFTEFLRAGGKFFLERRSSWCMSMATTEGETEA